MGTKTKKTTAKMMLCNAEVVQATIKENVEQRNTIAELQKKVAELILEKTIHQCVATSLVKVVTAIPGAVPAA